MAVAVRSGRSCGYGQHQLVIYLPQSTSNIKQVVPSVGRTHAHGDGVFLCRHGGLLLAGISITSVAEEVITGRNMHVFVRVKVEVGITAHEVGNIAPVLVLRGLVLVHELALVVMFCVSSG